MIGYNHAGSKFTLCHWRDPKWLDDSHTQKKNRPTLGIRKPLNPVAILKTRAKNRFLFTLPLGGSKGIQGKSCCRIAEDKRVTKIEMGFLQRHGSLGLLVALGIWETHTRRSMEMVDLYIPRKIKLTWKLKITIFAKENPFLNLRYCVPCEFSGVHLYFGSLGGTYWSVLFFWSSSLVDQWMVDFGKRCTRNIEEEPAFSTPPTKTNFDPAYVSFATP